MIFNQKFVKIDDLQIDPKYQISCRSWLHSKATRLNLRFKTG